MWMAPTSYASVTWNIQTRFWVCVLMKMDLHLASPQRKVRVASPNMHHSTQPNKSTDLLLHI